MIQEKILSQRFIKSIKIAKKFKNVEILWASVREPYNFIQAKQLGCHIITIPPSIIEKIKKFGKTFDQLTRETVKAFLLIARNQNLKFNNWLRGTDLNRRPSGYEPDELPDCSTPR